MYRFSFFYILYIGFNAVGTVCINNILLDARTHNFVVLELCISQNHTRWIFLIFRLVSSSSSS